MEIAEVDGLVLVRIVYPVGDGGRVELIQASSGSENQETVAFGVRQEELGQDTDPQPSVVSERKGIALMLRGLDNLEALESLRPLLR